MLHSMDIINAEQKIQKIYIEQKKEMSVFQEAINISNTRNIPLKLISKLVNKSREPKKIFFLENCSSRTLESVQLS